MQISEEARSLAKELGVKSNSAPTSREIWDKYQPEFAKLGLEDFAISGILGIVQNPGCVTRAGIVEAQSSVGMAASRIRARAELVEALGNLIADLLEHLKANTPPADVARQEAYPVMQDN